MQSVRKAKTATTSSTGQNSALKAEFKDWVAKLRGGDEALRSNMRKRMNEIIAKHYGPNSGHLPGKRIL
jgi:hypothetical protein